MRHIHQDVLIDAPVRHVWALSCQVERQAEWNPYMDVRNVSGPLDRPGTTFDSTLKLLGQQVESKGTVVEVAPERLLHIHGTDDRGGTSDWYYRYEPMGDRTRCALDIDYEVAGTLAGVVDTLVYHRAIERAVRHMAENFRALAEEKVPEHA